MRITTRNETIAAFRNLLKSADLDGEINNRSQTILIASLLSRPVHNALEEAFAHFSHNYDDAKSVASTWRANRNG